MLWNVNRGLLLGPLVVAGIFLTFMTVEGGQGADERALSRALSQLPRQPEKVVLIARAEASERYGRRPDVEAFAAQADRTIYLVRQGTTLRSASSRGPGIHDYALAGIIWHEMAHLDGADEAAAQRAEEQFWTECVLAQRVDRTRGMQYLALLRKRRGAPKGQRPSASVSSTPMTLPSLRPARSREGRPRRLSTAFEPVRASALTAP